MFDVKKIRCDFPMFENYKTMQNKRFCYLDSAATSFKPYSVIKASDYYYESLCANSHRGDYDLAHQVDVAYENARETVAKFINAKPSEIVFTSGDSESLNIIAYGLAELLNEGDEIILSEAEHASNILPWFAISHLKKVNIKYVPISNDGQITLENLEKTITNKTKIVSLAQVSNVLGRKVDIKSLANLTHKHGAIFVCDGAQSVPHMKVDVKDLDVDFLAFSGHKMLGPTGTGVMYGKYELLEKIPPLLTGGGMNSRFDTCGLVSYKVPPTKFEAGTQNIAGVLGLAKACEYLTDLGMDNIEKYELELRKKIIAGLENNSDVILYNKNADTGIITFNFKGVFAQDGASLLNSKGVCVRSGNHCAKILIDYLKADATIRASLYFYNDEEDVEQFVDACKHGKDFLDAFFN